MKLLIASSLLGMGVGSWICSKFFDEFWDVLTTSVPNEFWNVLTTSVPRVISHVIPMEDDDKETIVETRLEPHFLTKIQSFSLFSYYGIDRYETKEFTSGDYKWRLILYPYGKEKDNRHVSIYLAMAETNSLPVGWEVNVIFTIFLYNQMLDKYHCVRVKRARCFNKTKSEWGFSKYISEKSLRQKSNGYLVDDNLVFGANVFVVHKKPVDEIVALLNPQSAYKHIWNLDFTMLEDVWTSEQFHTRGFNWKIRLYPKGALGSKYNVVPVYLVCVSADTFDIHRKVKVEFCMHLKGRSNADSGQLSHWYTSSNTTWGFSFMNIAKDFLVDGRCTLGVDICVQVIV
ncbi:hypothetical protein ACP275_10G184600 [Erythranthe tilingii]